jgi:TonB family protein
MALARAVAGEQSPSPGGRLAPGVQLARISGTRAIERLIVAFGTCWATLAAAQADADSTKVDPKFESSAEQARREADKVFKWIRIHSDAPRRPGQPASAAAPAPTPGPAPKAAAPQAATARPQPAPVVRPATPAAPAAPAASAARPSGTGAGAGRPAAVLEPAGPASSPAAPLPRAAEATPAASTPIAGAAAAPSTADEPDERPLVLAVSVEPEFPALLTRRLRKGWVQVRLAVNPDGSVGDVEVVGSSHPRLNESALAAARRWVFEPPGQARQATAELAFDVDNP